MRSIKSRSKRRKRRSRLQRGGVQKSKTMTIQEWYDNFYTIRNNPNDNKYFGKQYIFISNVIDTKYADMENTYIISVRNVKETKSLDIQDFTKLEKLLKRYNNSDEIEITYDDTITLDDGTEINLKTDPIYIRIKDLVKDKIQKFIDNAMKKKIEALKKSLGSSGKAMIISPQMSSAADIGEVEYLSQEGGKRSRKRRRTRRRRKSRKY